MTFYGFPKANTGVMPECATRTKVIFGWIDGAIRKIEGPVDMGGYPRNWDLEYPDLYITWYIETDIPR